MCKRVVMITVAVILSASISYSDFKYTQMSKWTRGIVTIKYKRGDPIPGEAAINAAVAAKRKPRVTTYYVKGNRLRTDQPDGQVRIIDLDGRRVIDIDNARRTYSVTTLAQLRATLDKAQEQMQSKVAGVEIIPKTEVTPTTDTKVILGETTHQVKMNLIWHAKSQDPKQNGSAKNIVVSISCDMWIAPGVRGYDEVRRFHKRMGEELNRVLSGNLFTNDLMMAQALQKMQELSATLNGMPLLRQDIVAIPVMAMAFARTSQVRPTQKPDAKTAQVEVTVTAEGSPEAKPSESEPQEVILTNPQADLGKAQTDVAKELGGIGMKKEQQEALPAVPVPSPAERTTPLSSSPMSDETTEVTSFSGDLLAASLFEIPAGYREVPGQAEEFLKAKPK